MNNPIHILTQENTVLKLKYYELLDKLNKATEEINILQTNMNMKQDTYKNTLAYLQNANIELQQSIIDKNKQLLQINK